MGESERGRERERGRGRNMDVRETAIGCLLPRNPTRDRDQLATQVQLGIKPTTLQFRDQHSNHLDTLARAKDYFLISR